jgi:hypothetical protein
LSKGGVRKSDNQRMVEQLATKADAMRWIAENARRA